MKQDQFSRLKTKVLANARYILYLFAEPGDRNRRHDVKRKSFYAITYHKICKTEIIQTESND